jgi:hypothetical protein
MSWLLTQPLAVPCPSLTTDKPYWDDDTIRSDQSLFIPENKPVINKGFCGVEPMHVALNFKAKMFIAGAGIMEVPTTIKAFDTGASLMNTYMHRVSTDGILLGSDSIYCLNTPYTTETDKLNHCPGIALLDRIIQLQQDKSVVQLKGMFSTGGFMRADNSLALGHDASLILEATQLKQEGLQLVGKPTPVLIEGDVANCLTCPVCLEGNKVFVPLQCSHCFCVDCLTTHMTAPCTESGRTCPMCRALIVPRTSVVV